ncbi:hypothetical protein [Dictyobacter aurantiacus]|uniref:Uncharacterized protein n=1 Tax=Dictyobacter aurantiacus TaxID=1936993 RepID=A0A401ZLA5_9CHLR|nr:hypothetical protein [Dictyobacter aurantiacus]GCE07604.1 hypothetical protein KDAU_49330 [Dictyobacter aurantiacus]
MQQLPPQEPAFSSHSTCTSLPLRPLSTKKIALKYGLVFGAILVLRYLIGNAVIVAFSQASPQFIATYHLSFIMISPRNLQITTVLLDWIIYFLAGFFVARRARQVTASVIACIWASLCYTLAGVVTGISVIAVLSLLAGRDSGYLFSVRLHFIVMFLLLHFGMGTSIGALGGLLEKNMAPPRTITPP